MAILDAHDVATKAPLMEVGIRQLRNQLSEFLRRVQDGEELVITDRGRPVARVVPMKALRRFDQLIEQGLVTPAKVRDRWLPPLLPAKGSVSAFVIEQRRG